MDTVQIFDYVIAWAQPPIRCPVSKGDVGYVSNDQNATNITECKVETALFAVYVIALENRAPYFLEYAERNLMLATLIALLRKWVVVSKSIR
jgi:hypothetical protein